VGCPSASRCRSHHSLKNTVRISNALATSLVQPDYNAMRCNSGAIPRAWVSSPGESHPEALVEPYVSLSTHTAPITEPRRVLICQ
jgi:hypothetical protein